VQSGRVHVVGDAWGLGGSITSADLILDDLEQVVFPRRRGMPMDDLDDSNAAVDITQWPVVVARTTGKLDAAAAERHEIPPTLSRSEARRHSSDAL
jgi:hypothetical protein